MAALVVVGAAVGGALALRSVARPAAPPASALDEALAAPPVSAADTAPSAPLASAPEAAPPASAPEAAPSASTSELSGEDGSKLPVNEGYLVVRFAEAGEVYLTGIAAGQANQKLRTRCGLRYTRVGENPLGRWLSVGQTVDIKCQAVTDVTLAPLK